MKIMKQNNDNTTSSAVSGGLRSSPTCFHMKQNNDNTTSKGCFWRPEELQLLAEVSIHLDRGAHACGPGKPCSPGRGFGTTKSRWHQKDSSKRKHLKKGFQTNLQNWLWSSLWEVLTAESLSLNKENKLVMCQTCEYNLTDKIFDSSYLHLFWNFTSFDSHLWDYPRQASILHQPEFLEKFSPHQLARLKVSSHYESLENFYQMAAQQAIWQFLWG